MIDLELEQAPLMYLKFFSFSYPFELIPLLFGDRIVTFRGIHAYTHIQNIFLYTNTIYTYVYIYIRKIIQKNIEEQ